METKVPGMATLYDVKDIMKVVEQMPEDICYHSQATKYGVEVTSACVYAKVTDNGIVPICFAGYIIFKLDPELLSKIIDRVENTQGLAETFLYEEFTHPAFRLLEEWQAVQDRNQMEPWSRIAIDHPLEVLG